MGAGEAGSVAVSSQSGCSGLGLRRRERRELTGREMQEQLRPKWRRRQVVLAQTRVVICERLCEQLLNLRFDKSAFFFSADQMNLSVTSAGFGGFHYCTPSVITSFVARG